MMRLLTGLPAAGPADVRADITIDSIESLNGRTSAAPFVPQGNTGAAAAHFAAGSFLLALRNDESFKAAAADRLYCEGALT